MLIRHRMYTTIFLYLREYCSQARATSICFQNETVAKIWISQHGLSINICFKKLNACWHSSVKWAFFLLMNEVDLQLWQRMEQTSYKMKSRNCCLTSLTLLGLELLHGCYTVCWLLVLGVITWPKLLTWSQTNRHLLDFSFNPAWISVLIAILRCSRCGGWKCFKRH